jgi:myo-inositol-1(or 4)-monophosphatase
VNLADAVGITGFSNSPEVRRQQALVFSRLAPHVLDLRQYGSAALDLCAIALGTHDFYFERGLDPWDHAAGALIADEAGVFVSIQSDTLYCGDRNLIRDLEALMPRLQGSTNR